MKKILLVLLASAFLGGCLTVPKTGSIWFENKSGETISCFVDGNMVFTVEPGKTEILTVPAGSHAWEAKSDKGYWHGSVDLALGQVTHISIEAGDS